MDRGWTGLGGTCKGTRKGTGSKDGSRSVVPPLKDIWVGRDAQLGFCPVPASQCRLVFSAWHATTAEEAFRVSTAVCEVRQHSALEELRH